MKILTALFVSISLGAVGTVTGQDLLGADALMKKMEAGLSGGADADDPIANFSKLYKAAETENCSPEQWLGLFDAFFEIPKSQRDRGRSGGTR